MTVRTNSKNEQTNGSNPAEAAASEPATTEETSQPKKHARTMKSPSRKTASSKATGSKSAAKKGTAKARTTRAPRAYEPSDADVRLRAYFIAERRVQLALQGDPGRDWIEARQQLLAEAQAARR